MRLLDMFRRKKKKAVLKAHWWEGSKHQGVRLLCAIYRVDQGDLIRLAAPYKNFESRPTKKNHIHHHRRPGSKLLKKHSRTLWRALVDEGAL